MNGAEIGGYCIGILGVPVAIALITAIGIGILAIIIKLITKAIKEIMTHYFMSKNQQNQYQEQYHEQ